MRTLILLMLLGSIVFVACDIEVTDVDGFPENLFERFLEEKQKERRLEKEREEKRGSNKFLYELEKILKRQDRYCKKTGVACYNRTQCCSQKCVLQPGYLVGKCEE